MEIYGPLTAAQVENLGADPAATATSVGRIVFRTDLKQPRIQIDATTWAGLGGGGGGGGGLRWNAEEGTAPLTGCENGELVYLYEQGKPNRLSVFLKVPQSYPGGQQITMYHSLYSPSTSNVFRMQTASYLIRSNTDAVTSTLNSNIANTGDITNTVANQYRQVNTVLTDGSGQINGVAVSGGDLIRVDLTRVTPTGTDDSEDIRFIPSSTEVTFT